MMEKIKAAWTKVVVFIWLSLAVLLGGCAKVPEPAVFQAISEACKAQGKGMKVEVVATRVSANCE